MAEVVSHSLEVRVVAGVSKVSLGSRQCSRKSECSSDSPASAEGKCRAGRPGAECCLMMSSLRDLVVAVADNVAVAVAEIGRCW